MPINNPLLNKPNKLSYESSEEWSAYVFVTIYVVLTCWRNKYFLIYSFNLLHF